MYISDVIYLSDVSQDLGLDGFVQRDTCTYRKSCTKSLVDDLKANLSASKYFTRHGGRDHVVLWSLGHYHPWPRHCDTFMKKFCGKCAFTCYWMDPTMPGNNFISIPFPSSYHWWDGIRDGERATVPSHPLSDQTLLFAYTLTRSAMGCNRRQSKG